MEKTSPDEPELMARMDEYTERYRALYTQSRAIVHDHVRAQVERATRREETTTPEQTRASRLRSWLPTPWRRSLSRTLGRYRRPSAGR
jgi:hypothetical protein